MADQKQKSLVESVQQKAQEIAYVYIPIWNGNVTDLMRSRHEDFHQTKVLVADAAKSGAYLYPIKVNPFVATAFYIAPNLHAY